ncbi:hypothetical protein DdX_17293 [Ditylenchus destructor]|uniref:Uncharacterized protein n=1 Tax=Ditylenchus destructor TaxID=166010 RepID=A0AAD4MP93_9BILA|nr:hypothetical protein DdX_17293 [Ditylenchus destructor]
MSLLPSNYPEVSIRQAEDEVSSTSKKFDLKHSCEHAVNAFVFNRYHSFVLDADQQYREAIKNDELRELALQIELISADGSFTEGQVPYIDVMDLAGNSLACDSVTKSFRERNDISNTLLDIIYGNVKKTQYDKVEDINSKMAHPEHFVFVYSGTRSVYRLKATIRTWNTARLWITVVRTFQGLVKSIRRQEEKYREEKYVLEASEKHYKRICREIVREGQSVFDPEEHISRPKRMLARTAGRAILRNTSTLVTDASVARRQIATNAGNMGEVGAVKPGITVESAIQDLGKVQGKNELLEHQNKELASRLRFANQDNVHLRTIHGIQQNYTKTLENDLENATRLGSKLNPFLLGAGVGTLATAYALTQNGGDGNDDDKASNGLLKENIRIERKYQKQPKPSSRQE